MAEEFDEIDLDEFDEINLDEFDADPAFSREFSPMGQDVANALTPVYEGAVRGLSFLPDVAIGWPQSIYNMAVPESWEVKPRYPSDYALQLADALAGLEPGQREAMRAIPASGYGTGAAQLAGTALGTGMELFTPGGLASAAASKVAPASKAALALAKVARPTYADAAVTAGIAGLREAQGEHGGLDELALGLAPAGVAALRYGVPAAAKLGPSGAGEKLMKALDYVTYGGASATARKVGHWAAGGNPLLQKVVMQPATEIADEQIAMLGSLTPDRVENVATQLVTGQRIAAMTGQQKLAAELQPSTLATKRQIDMEQVANYLDIIPPEARSLYEVGAEAKGALTGVSDDLTKIRNEKYALLEAKAPTEPPIPLKGDLVGDAFVDVAKAVQKMEKEAPELFVGGMKFPVYNLVRDRLTKALKTKDLSYKELLSSVKMLNGFKAMLPSRVPAVEKALDNLDVAIAKTRPEITEATSAAWEQGRLFDPKGVGKVVAEGDKLPGMKTPLQAVTPEKLTKQLRNADVQDFDVLATQLDDAPKAVKLMREALARPLATKIEEINQAAASGAAADKILKFSNSLKDRRGILLKTYGEDYLDNLDSWLEYARAENQMQAAILKNSPVVFDPSTSGAAGGPLSALGVKLNMPGSLINYFKPARLLEFALEGKVQNVQKEVLKRLSDLYGWNLESVPYTPYAGGPSGLEAALSNVKRAPLVIQGDDE